LPKAARAAERKRNGFLVGNAAKVNAYRQLKEAFEI